MPPIVQNRRPSLYIVESLAPNALLSLVNGSARVGVLSALSTSVGSFLCTDFQVVNTGGPGPSEDELSSEVLRSGLVPALP